MRVLDHVAFEAENLDEASRWYAELLGLAEQWRISNFNSTTRSFVPDIAELASLAGDGIVVHLYRRNTPRPRSARGFDHFCIAVADLAEVEHLRRRWFALCDRGDFEFMAHARVTDVETDDDGSSVYLGAPDGVLIEVHSPPPALLLAHADGG